MKKTRIAPLVLAAMTAASTLLGSPAAHAADQTLVSFGDSVWANPLGIHMLKSKFIPGADPCPRDPEGIAKQTAWKKGLDPIDYSCAGGSVRTGGVQLRDQVDHALADGTLNEATGVVIINIGFNDTYPSLFHGESEQQIRDRVIPEAVSQVNRIKEAAPNAQVKLVGYPTVTKDEHTCLFQMGNNIHTREHLPFVSYIEWLADDMLRTVAAQTETGFIDLKQATADHGMCAPDGQRWYGALFDLGQPRNLIIHPSVLGTQEIGRIIAENL